MLKYFFLVFVISNVNATMKEMLDKILNPDPNAQKQKEIVRGRKLLDEMINSNSRSATNNFDVRIADSPRSPAPLVRDDYTIFSTQWAFKVHTYNLNWNNARQVCINEGAQLATLTSLAEEKVIRDKMSQMNTNEAFIGIHNFYNDKEWTSVEGVPIEMAGYDNWRPGEPHSNGLLIDPGSEHCAVLHVTGGMSNLDCRLERYFICKKWLL